MYGAHRIDFAVVRRRRKTLEIAVEPDASVVVAAPLDASIEAITEKVRKRAAWVRRQQRFFSHFMPRTPERRYLAGETHLYLGRQYRLKVLRSGRPGVEMTRGFITVRTREPDRPEVTRRLVEGWYRKQARAKFVERLEASLTRFPDPEAFRPAGLIVRRMDKRWGSLSPSGRLLLNRRLIEAPVDTIDYVVAHELCHMAEPHHGPEFYRLLDLVMPDWAGRKERLEKRMA
ncbi:MAG: SprT family zinc-dependent metalloprotease [Gemmatimonadota bacterium]|nr:SprT family zinc-dependent metalloprotease [Gemmatimonadota bacterium]